MTEGIKTGWTADICTAKYHMKKQNYGKISILNKLIIVNNLSGFPNTIFFGGEIFVQSCIPLDLSKKAKLETIEEKLVYTIFL